MVSFMLKTGILKLLFIGGILMKLSARNQFKGKVVEVKEGVVTTKVVVDIGGGNLITSIVSMDSLNELGIKIGSEVTAVVKSTSVMLMA
jgi:molybdopterin-binding protein